MEERYWLSQHCFVCVVDEVLVCWDTSNGQHYVFPAPEANALHGCVRGWPKVALKYSDEVFDTDDVAADLIRKRILVKNRANGKEAFPVSPPHPSSALSEEYERNGEGVTVRATARFMAAILSALPMRAARAHNVLRNARRRTQALDSSAVRSDMEPTDQERSELKQILFTFESLRPLLWDTRERALHDQAVLLKMLEHRGFRPSWIFGISNKPLRMWSWLQCGSVVIDHSPDVVAMFVPIAVA